MKRSKIFQIILSIFFVILFSLSTINTVSAGSYTINGTSSGLGSPSAVNDSSYGYTMQNTQYFSGYRFTYLNYKNGPKTSIDIIRSGAWSDYLGRQTAKTKYNKKQLVDIYYSGEEFRLNFVKSSSSTAIKDTKSAIIFHSYLDDMQNLTFEQRGVLMSALLFYAKTHGAEEIPEEIADKLNEDFLLCFMFQTFQQREAKATKEWCNHRGTYAKKHTYFMFEDGTKKKIKGNIDNAPRTYEDEDIFYRGKELKDFIDFGNSNEWEKPYKELLEDWFEMYPTKENSETIENDDLPF